MATDGYPKVPLKAWRTLRSKAASAPSTKFTPPVVAALMGMASPKSAANNTVAPMRRLGLIADDGSLTPRGNKWRVDASYAEACQEMVDDVYPSDLVALTDTEGSPDPQRVRNWFDHNGFGESNARQMAATYVMIAKKSIPQNGATVDRPGAAAKKAVAASRRVASTPKTAVTEGSPTRTDAELLAPTGRTNGYGPNVHLDIQIHIPAEATPEQIDQIFESMARHLYAK